MDVSWKSIHSHQHMVTIPVPGALGAFVARMGHRVLTCYYWALRPVTVGVKTLLVSEAQEVLLVRHTYRPGWHIPGGTLGRGESVAEAAARELYEEVGIRAVIEPKSILGVFQNRVQFKHDHVVLFHVKEWVKGPLKPCAWEIAEAKFFPLTKLPEDVSPGTRRRLAEFLGTRTPDFSW